MQITGAVSEKWIERWLETCADLAELERSNGMTYAVIDEIDGRMIRVGDRWLADFASRFLFEHGIYVTLAAYPLVPRNEVGFRIQITDANTVAEIEQLVDVLEKLANTFDLQPARAPDLATDAQVAA